MKIKLITLLATGSLLALGAAAPAFAGSPMTEAFVANAQPNVDYLDGSSRLAMSVSPNPRIRAFAKNEAIEQTIAANSFVAWTQTDSVPRAVATVDGPLGPVVGVAVVPLNVATEVTTNVATGVGGVLTGRSVALDNPLAPVVVQPVAAPAPLLLSGDRDMDRLSALKGHKFDALYVSTQTDALRQLATLYTDYISNGDDPGLRALAVSELPKINHRLAELRRL